MLTIAQGDLRDGYLIGIFQRPLQEEERFDPDVLRLQVIRALDVQTERNLVALDELHDVDRLGGLQRQLIEVFFGDDDELVLSDLVSLQYLIEGHHVVVGGAMPLLLDRQLAMGAELPERDRAMCLGGEVHADRDGYHPETDRAPPHRPGHAGASFAELPGLYRRLGRSSKRCSDLHGQPLRIEGAKPFMLEIDVDAAAKRTRLRLAIAMDQSRAHPLDQVGDLGRVPGSVAKLERHPPPAGQQRDDPRKPAFVEWRGWRKLEEQRTQPLTEAGSLERQHADRFLQVGHAPVVRDAPLLLDCQSKVLRYRGHPTSNDFFLLGPI